MTSRSPTLFVTSEERHFLASEQLREVGIELGAALLEPVGRNTAPALTLAAQVSSLKREFLYVDAMAAASCVGLNTTKR